MSAAFSKSARWWRMPVLAALAWLALLASPSTAISGVDDPPPPAGPLVIWLRPGLATIVDQGSVAVVGDADIDVQACESLDDCAIAEQEGVDNVVIVDQSPTAASAASETAASDAGAAPR